MLCNRRTELIDQTVKALRLVIGSDADIGKKNQWTRYGPVSRTVVRSIQVPNTSRSSSAGGGHTASMAALGAYQYRAYTAMAGNGC